MSVRIPHHLLLHAKKLLKLLTSRQKKNVEETRHVLMQHKKHWNLSSLSVPVRPMQMLNMTKMSKNAKKILLQA